MSRVSIHIVAWNSRKYLPQALASIFAQTCRDFSVLVVDNASTDGSIDLVRSEYPDAGVLRNFNNLGFARAHNQAVAFAKGRPDMAPEFILVTNPDIILQPDFLEKMIVAIERRPEIGSVCGKLLKIRDGEEEMAEPVRTDIIDSAGLKITKSRRFVDRGSGEKDAGQFGRNEEVFGASGALAFYRLAALDAVAAATGEVFDEDLFAYKEDADLAWRLRLLGWPCLYVPDAVAYHFRGVGGRDRAGSLEIAADHRGRSKTVSFLSLRNHWLTLIKNDYCLNRFIHWPRIFWFEFRKWVWSLVFQPVTYFKAWFGALCLMPKMLCKRRRLMKRAKLNAKEMRKWIV